MADTKVLDDVLFEALEAIDVVLAGQDIHIQQRPLLATVTFVEHCVVEVSTDGGRTRTKPEAEGNFLHEPWFGRIYTAVETWYRTRYGNALDNPAGRTINGVVLVFQTPFRIRIPTTVTTTGKPGETIWLMFPDNILEHEDALRWIDNPPNLEPMSLAQRQEVRETVIVVASTLRRIRVLLMGATGRERRFQGFYQGVVLHLESAAELLLRAKGETTQKAYWELQMACESVFKALLLQKTGSFPETHDLFCLFDRAVVHGLSIDRKRLGSIPRWQEMANLRYAQGTRTNVAECYECYRTVLDIIAGVAEATHGIRVGAARFEIAIAPWLKK
jgi:hypothetical protein